MRGLQILDRDPGGLLIVGIAPHGWANVMTSEAVMRRRLGERVGAATAEEIEAVEVALAALGCGRRSGSCAAEARWAAGPVVRIRPARPAFGTTARRGIQDNNKLGHVRWVVERTISEVLRSSGSGCATTAPNPLWPR